MKPDTLYVTDRHKLRRWFLENYKTAPEIWLIFPNKASQKIRVSYNDAVEEALCFGWIDSIVKRYDEDSVMQRFSPRRSDSYSQPNIERLRKLEANGQLMPEVLEKVRPVIDKEFIFPQDIIKSIKADPLAWENYRNFPPIYQRIRVAFIDGARSRPEEFQKRLRHFIEMTKKNKMYGFGGIEGYF